ncbi:DcrB-related protein [uncultured Sphingomonas sp.]|uniref:DcrB-related protein n=1 Tax=uncultured Sphingomonas sp. TaxID=158754 RepID=UPI0025FB6D9F|nr:DcrB-related protein [uncultured Sphingomonas sp.]
MAEAPVTVTGRMPPGWIDKSMVVHAAPLAPGQAIAPTIVIARDALGRAETFREYCNRQIDGFRATLPQFDRREEGPGRVHDFDAFRIDFTWMSGAGRLRQEVFFIAAPHGVVVTYTATAAEADFAGQEPVFRQGLADLVIVPVQG